MSRLVLKFQGSIFNFKAPAWPFPGNPGKIPLNRPEIYTVVFPAASTVLYNNFQAGGVKITNGWNSRY
jgi:hypothetical protein